MDKNEYSLNKLYAIHIKETLAQMNFINDSCFNDKIDLD